MDTKEGKKKTKDLVTTLILWSLWSSFLCVSVVLSSDVDQDMHAVI